MSFPKPIPLPDEVQHARKGRSRALLRIAFFGILIRFLIALIELGGYWYFESSSLLLDALATFVDVASSLFLIIFIKLAERPPDREHPFGHGRYEPLAGLQLGIFLAIGGLGMFAHEFSSFLHLEEKAPMSGKAWLLPLLACLLLEFMFQKIQKIAKREHSSALSAEAFHFRIDSLNSLLALLALLAAALFPASSWMLDRIGSMTIALFMVGIGSYSARSNLHQLLDRIPEDHFFEKVKRSTMQVPGVLGTEKIRIQLSGPDAHVDIDVEVEPTLSVEEAHMISQKVRHAIQIEWPQVQDVVVHIEPYYEQDHDSG